MGDARDLSIESTAGALLDRAAIAAVADAPAASLDARAGRALARAWLGSPDAADEARALFAAASSEKHAAIVCDATTVRAVAALAQGDVASAVDLARRASRMARTEALPEQEWLANLALARVRRLTNAPYLATRILASLARVATDHYRPWLEWELTMASGREAQGATRAGVLGEMLASAERGDREAHARAADAARRATEGLPLLHADVALAAAALDPSLPDALVPAVFAPFRCGAIDASPLGVLGLGSGVTDDEGLVSVLVVPGGRAVRVLSLGARLAESAGASRLARSQRRQGRADVAIAVLALAGPAGLAEADFFRAAYGFAFSRNVHRGVLDVLLHRVRKLLGDAASLDRDQGNIALSVRSPLLVTDPRCVPPDDDRVLRLLARRGRATAKDAADEIGIPLRSVQAVLESLIGSGACTRERAGRNVEYRVEDTTFQEPTGS